MLRLLLLVFLGLLQGARCSNSTCTFDGVAEFPKPVFGVENNLSFKNCGLWEEEAAPWRVAIDSGNGRYCFGVLISDRTVFTSNCKEFANEFMRYKSAFTAVVSNCYDAILGLESTGPCTADQKISISKVSAPGRGRNEEYFMWTLEKSVPEALKPVCLFNKGSVNDLQLYHIYDRKWVRSMEAEYRGTSAGLSSPSDVCIKAAEGLDGKDFSFDYLLSKQSGRFFLRGFFYWDLDNAFLLFNDVLPLMKEIVAASQNIQLHQKSIIDAVNPMSENEIGQ